MVCKGLDLIGFGEVVLVNERPDLGDVLGRAQSNKRHSQLLGLGGCPLGRGLVLV